ncbi:SH2B adapter protein 1 [Bulinus truncatus]|nr:SH2B adapter protein 1 [Bulinus truncatus]
MAGHSAGQSAGLRSQCRTRVKVQDTGHSAGHSGGHSTGHRSQCWSQCRTQVTVQDTSHMAGHSAGHRSQGCSQVTGLVTWLVTVQDTGHRAGHSAEHRSQCRIHFTVQDTGHSAGHRSQGWSQSWSHLRTTFERTELELTNVILSGCQRLCGIIHYRLKHLKEHFTYRLSVLFALKASMDGRSVKPRTGLFCFLITEARETTALEMPDRENTFVIKGEGTIEHVVEASDAQDLRAWLSEIKGCIQQNHCAATAEGIAAMRPRLPTAPSGSIERKDTSQLTSQHRSSSQGSLGSATPTIPPRPSPRPWSMIHVDNTPNLTGPISTSELRGSPRAESGFDAGHQDTFEGEGAVERALKDYPWFHGTLSRADAASLVLQQGPTGHGVFLVRKSETRNGEYVLTFNFQGRAKHLRMTINNESRCRVQHLWFETIFDMLEHFRTHPIPLESGGTSDVTLNDFIVTVERPRTPNASGVHGSPHVRNSVMAEHPGRIPLSTSHQDGGRNVMVIGGIVIFGWVIFFIVF